MYHDDKKQKPRVGLDALEAEVAALSASQTEQFNKMLSAAVNARLRLALIQAAKGIEGINFPDDANPTAVRDLIVKALRGIADSLETPAK